MLPGPRPRPAHTAREERSGKSHGYRHAIVFGKLHFQNVFRSQEGTIFEKTYATAWKMVPCLCRIRVDGRPDRRNKAAFSTDFSGVACALRKIQHQQPEYTKLKICLEYTFKNIEGPQPG